MEKARGEEPEGKVMMLAAVAAVAFLGAEEMELTPQAMKVPMVLNKEEP